MDNPDFFIESYTREEFLEVCEPIFAKMFWPVERVLQQANLTKDKVMRVIMVGGTTLIPFVR